jgi:hypothetical protein
MRTSGILTLKLFVTTCSLAAYSGGWLWTYRSDLLLLWEDASKWLAIMAK